MVMMVTSLPPLLPATTSQAAARRAEYEQVTRSNPSFHLSNTSQQASWTTPQGTPWSATSAIHHAIAQEQGRAGSSLEGQRGSRKRRLVCYNATTGCEVGNHNQSCHENHQVTAPSPSLPSPTHPFHHHHHHQRRQHLLQLAAAAAVSLPSLLLPTAAPLLTPAAAAAELAADANAGSRFFQTPGGSKVEEVLPGSGTAAAAGDTVVFNYVCRRSNGYFVASTVDPFDTNAEPLILRLGDGTMIAGLEEVMIGMKEGGKRRALIPPELGYVQEKLEPWPTGFDRQRAVMAHAREPLIFEVQILKIKRL